MNPFFNVNRKKVQVAGGGVIKNKFAMVNEENNEVLGIVGKDYEIVLNQTVNELFEEALSGYEIASKTDHIYGVGEIWKRTLIFDNDTLKFDITGRNDIVGLALQLFNSYNGRASFGYNLFGYRYICSNGMVFGKKSLFSANFHHYINSPEKLLNDFESRFAAFNQNVEIWKQWTKIPFTKDDFIKYVDSKKYVGERLKKAIVEYYETGIRKYDMANNRWGAFNVITDLMSNHTKPHRNGDKIFSRGYQVYEQLAEEFYKLPVQNADIKLIEL